MMPANARTSKKFTRMCFEKSEVTSAEKNKKIKMVVSKHLTHFCYPIRCSPIPLTAKPFFRWDARIGYV